MKPSLAKRRRTTSVALVVLLAVFLTLTAIPVGAQSTNPVPVQTFYVPFPEDQLLAGLQAIESGGSGNAPDSPVTTYISIAAVAEGTIIYYDQWENGYDADISNPGNLYSAGNLGGTQIWGDGNAANGKPPGYAADLIQAGDVILLNNDVPTDDLGLIDFDGRDKFAPSKTVAVTRTGWADDSNTLLAGAVEVFDTTNWGTLYRAPVGENVTGDADMFEYTALAIMAGEGGATVSVDANNDGDFTDGNDVEDESLLEGEAILVDDINIGGRVVSDKAVQVDILTGDVGSSYESRDSALLPVADWSHDYYTPVSTATSTHGVSTTSVWLYNPTAAAITVTYSWSGGSDTVSVPAGGTTEVTLTAPRAYEFSSTADFYAFSTTDSGSSDSGNNQAWDWGFSLIPQESLTPQVLVGLGIGKDPTAGGSENGNPLWITPVGNGSTAVTVYIDYDADPTTGPNTDPYGSKYDVSYSLTELQQQKVFDPDGDQTGLLAYVVTAGVNLAGAWGQDPTEATAGTPGLDVGTSTPPLPLFSAGKVGTLYDDPATPGVDGDTNNDGIIGPGDVLVYTIVVTNVGRVPVPDLIVVDTLPVEVVYVANTTELEYLANTYSIPDSSGFPLDGAGVNLQTITGTSLAVGKEYTITFRVTIKPDVLVEEIINTGTATAVNYTVPFVDITPLGGIGDFVWNDANGNGIQDAGELGIPGVIVKLLDSSGNLIAQTVTDADGFYHFTGLETGNYKIEFVLPSGYSFSPQNVGANDAVDSDANPATGQTPVFTWTAGTIDLTFDAGMYVPTPAITIVKTTNGSDGLNIPVGAPVTWTYVVTNSGTVPLTDVAVNDSDLGPITCPKTTLAVGESMTCTATGTAVAGAYSNIGTASGEYNQTTVNDTDPSSYFGTDPEITVTKTANPTTVPETGGNVTFTYVVQNTGNVTVTITELKDDKFGTLTGDGDCQVGTELAPAASCTFQATFLVPPGATGSTHTNVFTAKAEDEDDTEVQDDDPATVTRTDLLPSIIVEKTANPTSVPQTGGNVTFTYVVTNNGPVTVTITELKDDKFGTLIGDSDCQVGTILAPAASCTFQAIFLVPGNGAGGTHINTFTAKAKDAENNPVQDDDPATVTYNDVAPSIVVEKTANPITVPETGGSVTFTYVVANNGPVTVTITELKDDKFGTLIGDADCKVGTILAPAASCTFQATFLVPPGVTGSKHTNTFTAKAKDADNNPVQDDDPADVTYSDVLPSIVVNKTANPTSVPEAGGPVTFSYTVTNNGPVLVTITSLTDDKFGTLVGDADCKVGTELDPAESCSFNAVFTVPPGDFPGSHVNTFTAVAVDRDQNPVQDDDPAEVLYEEPPVVNVCPINGAANRWTDILGIGMGSTTKHKTQAKIDIPNSADVLFMYGQLAGKNTGAAKYVRFLYPGRNNYVQVNTITSPAPRNYAVFWYGSDLDAAANIRGRWFLQKSGAKNHIPRAFILYPTYETAPSALYVNAFEYFQTADTQVYWDGANNWTPIQEVQVEIPAPLAPTTFQVKVSVVENDRDDRPLIITVEAGGVEQTLMPTVPNMGDLLNILEFTLVNVPAGTGVINVTIESPQPYTHGLGPKGGDSGALLGVTANYACEEVTVP